MKIAIRNELPSDFEAVDAIYVGAFRGCRERDVVRAIRLSPGYRADQSFVASADDSEVVGHLMTSPIGLEGPDGTVRPVTVFAPLAVDPQSQNLGIGSALMRRAIAYHDDRQQSLLVLRGDLRYYERFGFTPSIESSVHPPFESSIDHYLVRRLTAYDASYRGTTRYPSTFASVGYPPEWEYQ
jgi:putative acetyltransferase